MGTLQINGGLRTVARVNASTHTLRFELGSPVGRLRFEVEPLKEVQVPEAWTQPVEDHRGKPVLRSTLEQYAPQLVPPQDPRIKAAKATADRLAKGEERFGDGDPAELRGLPLEYPHPRLPEPLLRARR